eukprot:CAMPEP_0196664118 /NCGR_PEP_ID=MMETSP1086-20130531/55759_1 /TAXON_ID=77921 /ORGANISM="Cyanoptyche  gloeocystis , Strain SAG4.97" /LENGTH=233 /DNA_ID=CAMNT_0042000265 /DNA_START=54 /DNA_END=752 /DNA_ORIENTATION=+
MNLLNQLNNLPVQQDEDNLIEAASKGDIESIKAILGKHSEHSFAGGHHPAALAAAAKHGHLDIVKLLAFKDARYWHAEKIQGKSMVRWLVGCLKDRTPYEDLVRACKMGNLNAAFLFARAFRDASLKVSSKESEEKLLKLSQSCIDLSAQLLDELFRNSLYKATFDPNAQIELLLILEFQVGSKTTLDMANELNADKFLTHQLVNTYIQMVKNEEEKEHGKSQKGIFNSWLFW